MHGHYVIVAFNFSIAVLDRDIVREYCLLCGMASQRRLVHHDTDPWGWVMVGSVLLANFITLGNLKALGVLLIAIHDDFDSDLWLIGWIAIMYSMVSLFCGEYMELKAITHYW